MCVCVCVTERHFAFVIIPNSIYKYILCSRQVSVAVSDLPHRVTWQKKKKILSKELSMAHQFWYTAADSTLSSVPLLNLVTYFSLRILDSSIIIITPWNPHGFSILIFYTSKKSRVKCNSCLKFKELVIFNTLPSRCQRNLTNKIFPNTATIGRKFQYKSRDFAIVAPQLS